ncbi:hypothetical protein [Sphingobacterium faecale]|uniref:DUF4843 domain-containing protein n=1 Tax=Sphingobacterium faecale TaxID=2803775 RepID=A0ABS1R7Z6_9SPHI|nr:hypothetical protein [Sphingobacterium faecale]MBL1410793.1 hypothetical protein [Sphingobacterium faecale]
MKKIFSVCLFGILLLANACKKDDKITVSEELGFDERFSPKEDDLPAIKEMFKTYDLWLRLNFEDAKEVTNAIVVTDASNRFGATPLDEAMKPSAIMFVDTLLHNVSKDYVRRIFPREFFFVKTYNGSYWKENIKALGRTRLIVCWPNEVKNAQPITVPETHYYQDSVVTRMVWGSLSSMLVQRMEGEIPGFEAAGMPYDKGKIMDEIIKNFPGDSDEEQELRNAELDKMAAERGYITANGSKAYGTDLSQWLSLLVLESFDNVKKNYLDNSPKRAEKYKVLTEYLKKEYNWDIQASGDKYREKLNSFQ